MNEETTIETTAPEETPTETSKPNKAYRWIVRLGRLMVKIAILTIVGCSLWIWVGNVYITHDNNMYPHVKDGDLLITYKLEGFIKDDVVLYETLDGKQSVGRVIGISGDVIDLTEDGYFAINGITPFENVFYTTRPVEGSEIAFPYEVPEGEVFILNDMRETPNDSRTFGSIPAENVLGKVAIIVRHRGM